MRQSECQFSEEYWIKEPEKEDSPIDERDRQHPSITGTNRDRPQHRSRQIHLQKSLQKSLLQNLFRLVQRRCSGYGKENLIHKTKDEGQKTKDKRQRTKDKGLIAALFKGLTLRCLKVEPLFNS